MTTTELIPTTSPEHEGVFELRFTRDEFTDTFMQFGKEGPVVAVVSNNDSETGFCVIGSEVKGSKVDLFEGSNIVGRDNRCDVVVNSPEASDQQLIITLSQGEISIQDKSPEKSTYLV